MSLILFVVSMILLYLSTERVSGKYFNYFDVIFRLLHFRMHLEQIVKVGVIERDTAVYTTCVFCCLIYHQQWEREF